MIDGGLITGVDGKTRCWWCGSDPLYVHYHDTEWGNPVFNDTNLFEKIYINHIDSLKNEFCAQKLDYIKSISIVKLTHYVYVTVFTII